MLKNKINILFDFDGTLVDSFQILIKHFNRLADEMHFRKVDEQDIPDLKNLSSREFIQRFQIPFYKIPKAILKMRKQVQQEIPHLLPFTNLCNVLHQLHQPHITLGIVTSNSRENVSTWLRLNKIEHLFSFIHNESSYFGKHRVLSKVVKKYKMQTDQTFYVGDETRDIEAAHACHISSVAVTWGFNSEKILLQQQPHYVVRQPHDLLSLLTS